MTPRFLHLGAAGLLALSTGCAGSYTTIQPDRIATYTSSPTTSPVDMAYQFDVLRLRGGNKKYAKKENKKGYRVAAVRLTNNSNQEVNFSRDLTLYYGDRPVVPVQANVAAADLKQGVAIYLLYLLLNVQVGGTRDVVTGQTTGGTFIPSGPFIAGANIIGASTANGNLRKEFARHDLTNRTLKPGETFYGIVSVRESSVAPMRLEMRTSSLSSVPVSAPPASAPAATPAPAPAPTPVPPAAPAPTTPR